jgi:HAMP domain-containing protein
MLSSTSSRVLSKSGILNYYLHSLRRFFSARLSWRIVLWIFISIAVIELILLIPSVERRRQEILDQVEEVSTGKINWILTTYQDATPEELLEHVQQLQADPMLENILGGAVYSQSGDVVGVFGDAPELSAADAQRGERLYRAQPDGDRYDVSWVAALPDGIYTIVIRHDAQGTRTALLVYGLRIVGLVIIISGFVTGVMMVVLGPGLINPILTLRQDLAKAGEAIAQGRLTAEFSSRQFRRRDELGEVISTFQRMFQEICTAVDKRRQVEQELRVSNQHMRRYLDQVDKITAAAMDVERDCFNPSCLAEVGDRSDELGNLARVFQRMVQEVKQREDHLRQQVSELRIEIDQARREREVQQVTQSDYFQELQSELDSLQTDFNWEE